jgi:phospholipid/cholesterol/gamma-HCH transport system ATP-binding protein
VVSEQDGARSGPAPAGIQATEVEAQLRAALERALASPSPTSARLSYARTSVRFRVTGGRRPATLLLDRRPPTLGSHDEPTEVEIELTSEQAARFAAGRLAIPGAASRGEIAFRGPLRKYLEVDPMLQALLAGAAGSSPPATNGRGAASPRPAGIASAIDPELLSIETRGLYKSFGSHQVLSGVNLNVPEGVVSVVLGPSGTGKSVLLQHIIGLMRADAGEVLVRGRSLSRMSRSEVLSLRTEIGVMFQDGALFSTMTLFDNVAFPLRQHTKLRESEIREVVMEHLASVGLVEAARKMPNQLSGGMRKRAGLARALVLDPGVLLCDEPDSGLDPVRTALLGDLLLEQHARLGGTILVITHNVDLARRISDHVSILYKGQVVESDLTELLMQSDNDFVRQFLAGEARGPLGMD